MNGWSSMGGDGWGDQPAWVYEITWEWEPQPGQRYPGDPGRRKAEYTPVYEASGHDTRWGTSSPHDEGRAPQGGYAPAPGRATPPQQGHSAGAPRRAEPLWNRPAASLPEQRGDEHRGRSAPDQRGDEHRGRSAPDQRGDEHRGRSTPDQRRSAPVYGRQAEPPAPSYRDGAQHREGPGLEGGPRPPQYRPAVPVNPGHAQPGSHPPAGRTAPVSPGSAPGGRATPPQQPVSPASPGVYGAARPVAAGPYYGRRQSPDEHREGRPEGTRPVSPAAGVYGSARPAPADAFPSRPGARPVPGQREDAPFDLRPAPPERGTPAQARPAPQPTRITPARPDQPAAAYPAPVSAPIPPQATPPVAAGPAQHDPTTTQPVHAARPQNVPAQPTSNRPAPPPVPPPPVPPQPAQPQWAQPPPAAQPAQAQPVSPPWAQPAAAQPVSAQPQPTSPQWAQPPAAQPVSAQSQPVSPQWAQPPAAQPVSAQSQPVSPQWAEPPAAQSVPSKPVSPYPAQPQVPAAQPAAATHPPVAEQPTVPAAQSSATYQASAPPSARPDHATTGGPEQATEPQAAEAPRRGSIWDRPAPSEAAVEQRPQPVSAVPASAPPASAAADEESHGLGWLLSQSGLGAVTPLPPPVPQAVIEPPAAHPVAVEPVLEPISPAAISSPPAAEPTAIQPAEVDDVGEPAAADEGAASPEALTDDARPVSGAPETQDWFAPSGAQPIVVPGRSEEAAPDLDDPAVDTGATGDAPAPRYEDLPYTNYEEPLAVQPIAVATPAPVEPVSAPPVADEPTRIEPAPTQPVSAQPAPTQAVEAETVEAQVIEAQAVEAQAVEAEPVAVEPVEVEAVAEQPIPHDGRDAPPTWAEQRTEAETPHEQWTPVEPVSAQPSLRDHGDTPVDSPARVDEPETLEPVSAPPFLAEPVSAQPYAAETPSEPETAPAWPSTVDPVSVVPADEPSVVDEPADEPVTAGAWDDDRPAVEFHPEPVSDDAEQVEAELLEFETAAGERVVVHAYQSVTSVDIVVDAELVDDDRREPVAALEAPAPTLAITAEPAEPDADPIEPTEERIEPVTEPVEPAEPITEPAEPITEPNEPAREPNEPASGPNEPASESIESAEPEAGPNEPIEDAAEPDEAEARPGEAEDATPAEDQPAVAEAPQDADEPAPVVGDDDPGETREPASPAYEIRTEPIRQRREQRADARSRRDPEQILAAYPIAFDPRTLREQIEDEEPMWVVIDRLTDKLEYAERDTDRARLLSLRAVASRLLGDLDPALEDAREALVHAEKTQDLARTATVRARLAHVLHWRGEYAEADKIYEEADSPELPSRLRAEIQELAGRSAFEQGRYLEAVNHLEHALDLRKGSDPDLVERIELALDTITGRTTEGWGPYPRTREAILGSSEPSRPLREETTGLWGYPGLMPPTFAQAQPFADGVAWVRRPEAPAWELIDLAGELLIDASAGYRAAGRFADGLAWVSRDDAGGWFAVDKQNRVIVPGGFEDARPFHNGLALVRRGGWGAVDQHGRVVVQPHYRAFATMLFGGEPVDGFTEEGLAVVDAGEVYGVVDRAGKLLVPPTHAALLIHPSAFLVADKFGLWGALNRAGQPLVELKYQDRGDVLERIDELVTDPRPVL